MKKIIQKISMYNIFCNIADAFRGEYIPKDQKGVPYEDIYRNLTPHLGKAGLMQDKHNLAKDMSNALKRYEQEKKTATS